MQKLGISGSNLPNAPHFENCKVKTQLYNRLDKRTGNDTYPPWTSWKGLLDTHPVAATSEQIKNFRHQAVSEGAYPPWVRFLNHLYCILDSLTMNSKHYSPTCGYQCYFYHYLKIC